MRAAGEKDVAVFGGGEAGFTLIREDDASWRPAPQHRFVRVHPVADLGELRRALRPLAPRLAAVATAGLEPPGEGERSGERAEVESELAAAGASRLCPPGSMQSPPLGWAHDGRPVLLSLARFCDRELAS